MEDNARTIESQSDQDHLANVLSRDSITPEMIDRLDSFFEFIPPDDFRDHLIELYHNYIMHEHDSLPHNFHQLAEGMSIFFDFLKFAAEEYSYPQSATEPAAGEK